MRSTRKLAWLGLCVGCVLIVGATALHLTRNSPERKLKNKDIVDQWLASRQFSLIQSESDCALLAQSISVGVEPESDGASLLVTSGKKAVGLFLTAFKTGKYEDYLRFAAPIPSYQTNPKCDDFISFFLKSRKIDGTSATANTVQETYWSEHVGELRRFEDSIRGIALKESLLSIYRFDNLPPDQLVSAESRRHGTRPVAGGYVGTRPLREFSPSPSELVKQHGCIYLMEAYLVVDMKRPRLPTSLVVWCYWIPEEQCWVPLSFMELRIGNGSSGIVF